MADSMSAAVVPGAKLLPNTTNGPGAVPLMVIPLLRSEACPLSGSSAEAMRLSFVRCLFADTGRVGVKDRGGARELLFEGLGFDDAEAERWEGTNTEALTTMIDRAGSWQHIGEKAYLCNPDSTCKTSVRRLFLAAESRARCT